MSDRDLILGKLPISKGVAMQRAMIVAKTVPSEKLWETFINRLEALKGELIEAETLKVFAGRAIYDDDIPENIKSTLESSVEQVWDAEIGVTRAEFAVAETGSLILTIKQGSARLNSLAPPIHVALVDPKKTVASLEDAFDQMPADTSVIISGPSRTADIEGIMVMGVHGPKRLLVVPIAENEPA